MRTRMESVAAATRMGTEMGLEKTKRGRMKGMERDGLCSMVLRRCLAGLSRSWQAKKSDKMIYGQSLKE